MSTTAVVGLAVVGQAIVGSDGAGRLITVTSVTTVTVTSTATVTATGAVTASTGEIVQVTGTARSLVTVS